MKIAMLAPPYLSVPPTLYGGTERIISILTEGLVKRGHDVTLFATGDSKTSATLSSLYPHPVGNSGFLKHEALVPLMHYTQCFNRQKEFDIIHSHGLYHALFLAQYAQTPVVHTWHGSCYEGEITEPRRDCLKMFAHQNFISVSKNQQQGIPEMNFVNNVYNSLDTEFYSFKEDASKDYIVWTGRIAAKKGPKAAIQAALKAGIPVHVAAVVDPIEMDYFNQEIKPLIDGKNVVHHGELTTQETVKLYQDALCTLYPISWHEPFGLVMAESMSCGTPVIAYNIGSVPEVVIDGETGYIVNAENHNTESDFSIKSSGIEGLVEGIHKASTISRKRCSDHVKEAFNIDRMISGYEETYHKLVS